MRDTEREPTTPPGRRALAALLLLVCAPAAAPALPGPFTDVTAAAGLSYQHVDASPTFDDQRHVAGGVGCGDYDGDGWLDLLVLRADGTPPVLFRSRGDGVFDDATDVAGRRPGEPRVSGPCGPERPAIREARGRAASAG
jgi:hypothetical protein